MTDTSSARDAAQAAASEQPQAGQPTSPASASEPQAGQNGAAPKSSDDYERMIAELRKENASHRTKLNAIEKAQQEAEEAKLSELEKERKARTAAETALNDRTRAYQERLIRAEIKADAATLGIIDPDAVVKLLDWSEFEYDDEGVPTNTDKLIADLLKAKPYLAPQLAQGQPSASGLTGQQSRASQAPATGATNPPRGGLLQGSSGTFAAGEIPKLTDPRLWKK